MKILLAPAETKIEGGDSPSYTKENFFFGSYSDTRDKIVKEYESFLQNSSLEELSKWFGLKNLDECEKYKQSIIGKPTIKAILRYTGVAFDALDYNTLSEKEQNYCDKNIILFSNLFGPLRGDDLNYQY